MNHRATAPSRPATPRDGLGRRTLGRVLALSGGAVLLVAALAGCGSSPSRATADSGPAAITRPGDTPVYRAVRLGSPIAKPSMRLTDTSGQPYDLAARTAGHATLLYFGYTHCPDECPTTMSDVAVALRRLPAADRPKVDVVFVTTDPARDTGPVVRAWLDKFDSSFTGLTGALPAITAAAASVGIPVEPPVKQADGSVTVDHGTELLAFGPDGPARVAFLSDATVDDLTHDLPLLIRGARP